MKELLKILKQGVVKSEYPYFGQYIEFSDKIKTCNGNVYVELEENKYPIEGCVNLFVLEDVLNNCEVPQISQKDYHLNIEDGDFKTSVIIDDLDFPSHAELDIDFVEVSEELLSLLKTAIRYVGDGIKSYIYMDQNYILAESNKEKLFYCKHTFDVPSVIGINSKILSALSEGVEIGTVKHNTVIRFDGGKIIYKISLLDNFPAKDIVETFVAKPELRKLCNIAILQNAVKKVSSILVNETSKRVFINSKNGNINVSAGSAVNGTSFLDIPSELEGSWRININPEFLLNVSLDYDVFVDLDDFERIYLSNGESEIMLVS